MNDVPAGGGRRGHRSQRYRRGLLLAVAILTIAALGPFAAFAVSSARADGGSGGDGLGAAPTTTTTSETVPGGSTVTATTPTTTVPITTTTTPYGTPVPPPPVIATPRSNPFATRGMWIWELSSTDDGSLPAIIAQSKQDGIQTLFIKSSDGTGIWPQFNPTLVSTLHEAGLRVCAWQFVYGIHPLEEAQAGAQAVEDGADCLVIDAESQYQGKYAQAQEYVGQLRARIGARFPLALAGFPYIDYHPSFPYSVFLGPNGAQYNAPQMYWQDIGTTVSAVYQHTYEFNELYQRPIFPLGQIYNSPPVSQILSFRTISRYYGATGVSWWDWQSSGTSQFAAVAEPAGPIAGFVASKQVASLGLDATGDVVVWAQEHLWNTHERVAIDGDFGADTQTAVEQFQELHDLPVTGVITPQTWNALLAVPLPMIRWVLNKNKLTITATAARAGGAGANQPATMLVPRSASLPARRDELGGEPGQGRPSSASR
jgi:peptidoglycan hydrolase-like protein with peptidoglycan-binding domain